MRSKPNVFALFFAATTVCVSGAAFAQAAPPDVPVVYQDANLFIRSGIVESGSEAIHLGDAITFVVDIEFDAGDVRIESPDEEWFQRSFAGLAGFRVYEPVALAVESTSGDRVHVMSAWRLQLLDCPQDMLSCPGSKAYELPIMTVSYELTDGARGSDSRSARFRPWPGAIVLAPSIAAAPQADSKLTDILPGGAYAQPLQINAASGASPWLLGAGAALLCLSWFTSLESRRPSRAAGRVRVTDSRWQRVLHTLDNATLSDDEWSDRLRRSISWYCLDELDQNPYAWLGAAGTDAVPTAGDLANWREFFLDVLQQHGIDSARREDFLRRFRTLGGLPDGPTVAATGR